MNEAIKLLKYESVMIRKSFIEDLKLESNIDLDSLELLKYWCATEQKIQIIESKSNEKHIGLRLSGNGNFTVFNITVSDFEKYFLGYGLITKSNAIDIIDYIDGYGNLIYEGERTYDDIKYDIMELAYDLENIYDPTAEQYLMFGKRFIERTISKGIVKNIPYAQLIEGDETTQQVQVLTDINYMAIGENLSRIIENNNVKFFEKQIQIS
ncbi:hypothetical protein [Ancylomarina sp. 16SWW S1-10-2]|uniref:hypothetical protein n=1 Tax=Ancylomarina sp. 16SWW S1-10-2 TaxID=2499681 RepID=UPI0012ADE447|nr:hypothetical protein [Ancylomarina sp. 16SWW S1-10-2]MRT93302.1 hypothetical protein [Ancylomarina sp. 16SWW S1-10-2]